LQFTNGLKHVDQKARIHLALAIFEVIKGWLTLGSIPTQSRGKLHWARDLF
jgi:hypothetical protein